MVLDGTSSYGLLSLSNQNSEMIDFNAIKISIASPEKIKSWSFGEVTKPETINYRTFKPERDGLFCARIFGPIKDYECLCGKYKRIKYKGIICEKCGVEVTSSKVRRERMGHIDLACPVSHIWFLKSLPSRISTILDIAPKMVERVLYFETYVVTDGKMSPLQEGEILSEEAYEEAIEKFGEGSFEAMMGAEGIKKLLEKIDLKKLDKTLRAELKDTKSELKRSKITKRLKLVESFLESDNRPEWMILTKLPVIPPEIRPLVMLDGGHFATSDLNELYRRVINRNNRLKRLLELEAPEIIIKNEKRMLQEAIDALLDNGRSGNIVKSSNKRPLKSLSDMLKGKQGRFRQNLLGKRVDYSGRSVIVVGPELRLQQCGLPKKMALELFKPFIFSKLELYGISPSIKVSKKMVEQESPEVWDILEEVINEHPVLLNRAPTLHRLSIQAFEPVLIEGSAIQLHPLVCKAFNADFDGDQMAVHVPLSIEAQMEARVLMMSTNNILSPQNGKPIITPSLDMILGLYYLSLQSDINKDKPKPISGEYELEYAINEKQIDLHSNILYRYKINKDDREYKKVHTTPGRIKLYNILPEECKQTSGFELINRIMNKKAVEKLVDEVYRIAGQKETCIFCDNIMKIGFKEACRSGISIGKDDIIIPQTKGDHISTSIEKVKKIDVQYKEGLITFGERYNKIIDIWSNCSDDLKKDMMKEISKKYEPKELNSLYLMSASGARGSETQLQQMCAMRGLMSKPNGEIIETPILSNFKEGLNVLEYFTSAHGARKGYVDTALKTSNAGYLTRRLVDVSQDCIITEFDCGTNEGITIEPKIENGKITIPLFERVLGRVTAEDILTSDSKEVLIESNVLIDEKLAKVIRDHDVKFVKVRSALTCKSEKGICAKCYGRDLTTGILVSVGEAVGVIAAQSVGEPGTQLTMDTKHLASASGIATQSLILATDDGSLKIKNCEVIENKNGDKLIVTRNCEITVINNKKIVIGRYKIPYGAKLFHENGTEVKKGEHLAEWDPYNIPLIAISAGTVKYSGLIENISIKERIDEITGVSTKTVIDWRRYSGKDLIRPIIEIIDNKKNKEEYSLSIGAILNVINDDKVEKGDILARIPRESSRKKDITGGLPRVAELFEARKPKNYSVMSEIDGTVKFDKDYKIKKKISIIPNDKTKEPISYMIPKGKYLFINDGDKVNRGDILMDGNPVPHDILRILGVEKFANYMINEIQKVYEMQGVLINDKHLEIILRMMLSKVEIIDSGETTLIVGEYMNKDDLEEVNKKAREAKLKEATVAPVLLGITRAALKTKSFISAASFQETTKVLTTAAIEGEADTLEGLKENIIVGRLIPAGTGLLMEGMKKETLLNKKTCNK
jgi:DNA-directed RNA polymerase subunit beta'